MKIHFKCNSFGIIACCVMFGLFYWLVPAPQSVSGKCLLYGFWGLFCLAANFIVVRYKNN